MKRRERRERGQREREQRKRGKRERGQPERGWERGYWGSHESAMRRERLTAHWSWILRTATPTWPPRSRSGSRRQQSRC